MLSDFLNSINNTKENILKDEKLEKEYLPFVVNKCFSYFPDTIFYANRVNQMSHMDKKIQYDYLLHSISKKKRFCKWVKSEKNEEIELIKQVFGYSDSKAREIVDLVPMDKIKEFTKKGGQKN